MEHNNVVATEAFETGASLAEHEYGTDFAPQKASSLLEGTNASEIVSQKEASKAIENLRAEIASDSLLNGNSNLTFTSPFERPPDAVQTTKSRYLEVPMVYCDQTASNRPVRSIEKYMENTCLPYYGNTHTNTSVTGAQSTAFVAEARQIVAEETNAKITGKASLDVVLFA